MQNIQFLYRRVGRSTAAHAVHHVQKKHRGPATALFVVCVLLAIAACATTLLAQSTTGSIYGRITDQSSAVISGAKVTATNQATGVSFTGGSDSQGNYSVFDLLPGLYKVTVQKDGFESATISNVSLEIDQKQLLNFEMKVGSTSEVVTVTSEPTILQTQTVETGNVVHSQDVLDLPLLGRNFLDLVALTPGVTAVGGSINAFNFSVSGGREYANSIQVDGVEATTNRTQDITVTPSVDAVDEFKVSTSAYSAEFGSSAGGSVAIQTKGGTNAFHGTAYEFFRPNFTAAKDYSFTGDPIPASILKQHNYGGTLGGPIFRNKTFFFVSFEQTHLSTAYDYVFFTQPKNQVKFLPDGSVDLSGLIDPFTGTQIPIYDPTVMLNCYGFCPQQFPGNIIPANRVSPAGVNIFNNFIPSPNLPGTNFGWFNNFQVHSPVTNNQKNADARLDHNISDKDHLSVVFHYSNGDQLVTDPYWGHTVVPGAGDGDQGNHETFGAQEYSITENHFFSGRMVNEARFGFTHYYQNQYSLLNGHDYSTQYGLNNVAVPGYPATDAFPWIFMGIGNFFGGSTYKPFLIQDDNFQIGDNFILSQVGKHEFKFGGDFRRLNSHPNFSLFPTDFLFFAGPYAAMTSDWSYTSPLDNYSALYGTGGNDIADLLMGLPLDVQRGLQLTKPHTRSWEMAYYAEDSYKLSPRVTLTFGLRYEYQAPYTEANNNASNYDIATDSLLLAGRGGNSAGLIASRWSDFGPRAGVSIQLNRKTVLRAGYGFFYSPENDGREDILTKNFPFAIQETFNTGSTGTMYNGPCSAQASPPPCVAPDNVFYYQIDSGFPRSTKIQIPSGGSSIPASSITDSTGHPTGSLETSYYVDPKLKTGYTQNFNLAIQREIGANFAVEAAYVGSLSHDLSYQVGNINRVNYALQNPAPFITPNLGQIIAIYDSGVGNYNSLQLKLTKRVSSNLNFQASYTYGHSIDNGPAPFNLGHINNDNPQDPRNLNAEIASSDDDVRHSFVFSGLYRLPIGRGQNFLGHVNKIENAVIGGWQLNSIFNARTGTPVNVVRPDNNDKFYSGLRPDLVGNPILPKGQRTPQHYFNTSAFDVSRFNCSTPPGCQFFPGTAGRNILTGPGYINLNLSLFKDFAITERVKLQTRFETFNTLNTPHFANPNSDMSSPAVFGTINRTSDNMRIVQLAAKIIF